MNTSKRIYFPKTGNTNTTKYVKFKLEQTINTYEVLSLKVTTKEAYQNFNADFGVLIGRVIANEGVGIPNAKISIFIPLEDEDAQNGEIRNIYPYSSPRDKDIDGKIYNLLPRVSKQNPITKIVSPKQPVGSFPIKEEILTNDTYLNIYKKYYKYTTVTNDSGDYMLFGIPIGVQTVHMSVDVTDIGKYSMNPSAMVTNLGYSPNLFTGDGSKIKLTSDLDNLPNVDTQEITVDVIPFWGDTENFEIGITRQDFKIRATLVATFTVFGTGFTDKDTAMWGQQYGEQDVGKIAELHYLTDESGNLPVDSHYANAIIDYKRYGKITEKIYYISEEYSDSQIDTAITNHTDMCNWYKLLDPTEYTIYKKNGDFVYVIACNRNKVYTNEMGIETPVLLGQENVGVYSKFRGFMTFEISPDDISCNLRQDLNKGSGNDVNFNYISLRYKFKFPQDATTLGHSFTYDEGVGSTLPPTIDTIKWRNKHFSFQSGKIYSVAKFNPTIGNGNLDSSGVKSGTNNGFLSGDIINNIPNYPYRQVGLICTRDTVFPYNIIRNESSQDGSLNQDGQVSRKWFGCNWLNFAIYFPQVGVFSNGNRVLGDPSINFGNVNAGPAFLSSSSHYTQQFYSYLKGVNYPTEMYSYDGQDKNKQKIAANDYNTFGFARSDLHWTTFIEVSTADIKIINDSKYKAFIGDAYNSTSINNNRLSGLNLSNYINGYNADNVPQNGGIQDASIGNNRDNTYYFFTGLGNSNCIEYLISLSLNQ